MIQASKRFLKSLAGASLMTAVVAQSAHATGLADLAAGIDKADIIAGFVAVALLIAAILASRMGIKKVLGMIR
ncbi:hypothetical protein ACWKWZ_07180 [Metapseudomonas otitidis]